METLLQLLILAGLALMAAGLYSAYVGIVKKKNRVGEALAGVDVQLTQRHDLIPNVLAIARRFMEHERGLLDEITALRAQASQKAGGLEPAQVEAKFAAEAQLTRDMGKLFAVAENYPQLKSDGPMIEAQRSYQEVETNIAAARRFYNASVAELKNAIEIFPGSLMAGLAGTRAAPPFFEAAEADKAPVDAAKLLG